MAVQRRFIQLAVAMIVLFNAAAPLAQADAADLHSLYTAIEQQSELLSCTSVVLIPIKTVSMLLLESGIVPGRVPAPGPQKQRTEQNTSSKLCLMPDTFKQELKRAPQQGYAGSVPGARQGAGMTGAVAVGYLCLLFGLCLVSLFLLCAAPCLLARGALDDLISTGPILLCENSIRFQGGLSFSFGGK